MFLRAVRISTVLLFTLASCSSEKKAGFIDHYKGVLPAVMLNDNGLFRGLDLGMTLNDAKPLIDAKHITEETSDYLLVEDSLSANSHYTFDCTFDAQGMREVRVDVFLNGEENADSLLADFTNYFTEKYGPPAKAQDGLYWLLSTGKRPAKIALVDETDFYLYGKLSITFYDRSMDPVATPLDSVFVPDTIPPAL